MSHVLVCGCSAPSHTLPHLALVRELVLRGHRVTYTTGEPLRELVAPTGADLHLRPSRLPAAGADDGGEWPQDPASGMRLFLEESIAALAFVRALDRPDLVLYDIGAHEALVAAHHWSVPAAVLSPSMVAWEGYEAEMAEVLEPLQATPEYAAYAERFDRWYAEHGMPRRWQDATAHPERGIVLIPRPMQPEADRVPAHMVFAGPALGADRLAEAWSPAVAERRVLYVAFGPAYTDRARVYRAAAEAAADAAGGPWHVVLSTGRVDPAELGDLPGSVEVHRRVPQVAVLGHADAFVTHAGMGSCAEALWQGVPCVAIPAAVDQPMNAARLEALGVGRTVEEGDADAAAIRAALEALTSDPAVAARGAALRDEVRAAGGAGHAADAVEALLVA